MKITPLEIRQHEFEKTFRGYNIEEVDSFLVNLSQEWERVLNESKMLRMQLEIAEKEANKLREIEMTLFKTLKTAEDTSTMITDQANQQADKHIQESKLQGEKLLIEAQQQANGIIRQAEERAKYIKEEVLGDVKVLERDFRAMDHYKTNLLVQMRSLSNATLDHVQRFEDKFDKEGVDAKFKEATSMLTDESKIIGFEDDLKKEGIDIELKDAPSILVEEDVIADSHEAIIATVEAEEIFEPIVSVEEETSDEISSIASEFTEIDTKVLAEESGVDASDESIIELPVADTIIATLDNSSVEEDVIEEPILNTTIASLNNHSSENQPLVEEITIRRNDIPKADELEIIEGIGPKIAMLFYDSGIFTFRDLAIIPVYKIQEILDQAGPQFARHDPSTWTQQAKLAAEGRWNDLEALKFYLVGGREPKKDETEEFASVAEVEQAPVEVFSPADEAMSTPLPAVVETVTPPIIEEVSENVSDFIQMPTQVENNLDSITEEMLEKVNKVKAAIRKAMVEKNDAPLKDSSPLPTLNDIIAKNESSAGNSFFDNI